MPAATVIMQPKFIDCGLEQTQLHSYLHDNFIESGEVLRAILLAVALLTRPQSLNHQQVPFNGVRLS